MVVLFTSHREIPLDGRDIEFCFLLCFYLVRQIFLVRVKCYGIIHASFVSRMRQTMSIFYLHRMLSFEGQSFPHGVQASVPYGNLSDISNFKNMNIDFCTMISLVVYGTPHTTYVLRRLQIK